ncbi:hypothetical protein B5M42_000410 [Paenibacillus athensensis]|uniref:Uncharacterized protein n=1 Tax=Paenibacillus athensensis TaxID=1967502 RepID=A0A4Y8Q7D2_9BACL|nr:DUF5984 family protein [Paenibacillus athensensis]MCD1257297.1 hypothetical protein [Paenibacillus athensensis]
MFKFLLKGLEEITPWGEGNQRYLHWFGLTDAWYWLDIEGVQLLRYSDEFLQKYLSQLPYVDYQLARLFWDFTGIVRDVLAPIPDEVFANIRTFENFEAYLDTLADWLEHEWDGTEEVYDRIYVPASQWVAQRRLDSSYLIGAPRIYFFRNGEQFYVRWIADFVDEQGVPMWQTAKGEYVVDFGTFVAGLQQSVRAFAGAMDKQVKLALDVPSDLIYIDRAKLLGNHEEFLREVEAYDDILSFVSDWADWEDVAAKITQIRWGG